MIFFSYFCSKHRLLVLVTSTNNLCDRAKIRKMMYTYPCKPQFYYIKIGCKGVYNTRTCLQDVSVSNYATRTPSLLNCSAAEDGSKNTTAEKWRSVCEHAKKVEAKYCARDNLCEREVHQCNTHKTIEV